MDADIWKSAGNGLIELVKVSGPYIVAVLGALFGYLGNKNAKEISIRVAELQSEKDLSIQRENHRFEDGKRISKLKEYYRANN